MIMPPKEIDAKSYHQKYLNLKKKFKALLYENESFQEELRKSQRKLIKISRDKSFLLDRLLKYENVETSTSDSEATVSSDSENELQIQLVPPKNRKRAAHSNIDNHETFPTSSALLNNTNEVKKKKARRAPVSKAVSIAAVVEPPKIKIKVEPISSGVSIKVEPGHMTSEEIERRLEAKQFRDLMPEKTPLTLPIEIFSNDPLEMDCDILD